ncbi:hypothetical protein [Hydrogenimonas cancrithermarum]|uniref:Uncharacterized protein n=1 Tax=Hydrogenimonas cancrithermarum TaxID=2993563 RepID=A0ABN6WSN9_9BACT|nr:hypothetical protein [Hydrogenimonas cancrithermarum]BDY11982.1 hypothetical protein HCR_02940 [Hydrogenimonas cancrithermarum]
MNIKACLNDYIKELEAEAMKIIGNPSTDKRTKNLAMKPLTSKKQIIRNTIDALDLVDRVHQEEMDKAKTGK